MAKQERTSQSSTHEMLMNRGEPGSFSDPEISVDHLEAIRYKSEELVGAAQQELEYQEKVLKEVEAELKRRKEQAEK